MNTLFDLDPAQEPVPNTGQVDQPIREDQVAAIREAFALAGISSQDRRRQIAESCVVRSLTSLRDLSAAEGHRVLKRIKDNAAAKPRAVGASDWDLREEDTWIDRL